MGRKYHNIEILNRVGKEKVIITTVTSTSILRTHNERYCILQLIVQGKILGRKRISWRRNLRKWFGCNGQLFRADVKSQENYHD